MQESSRSYNHKDYEGFMFHFNTITRTTYFPQDTTGLGLDHCFDCASEVHILKRYILQRQPTLADLEPGEERDATLRQHVMRMVKEINRQCSPSRTLEMACYRSHFVDF